MPGLFQLARIFFHVHYSSAGIFSWESPLYEVFIYLFIYLFFVGGIRRGNVLLPES